MAYPKVEVKPGESIQQVVARLEDALLREGIQLASFESHNALLATSGFSNFFQAHVDGHETILVVMTAEWSDENLVRIVNMLLEIRADPDPPGSHLRFHFYSAHPLPPLLHTLFGDYRVSEVECIAARLVQFGIDLRASDCTRIAAAATQFLASLGTKTDFRDPEGMRKLQDFVLREIRGPAFPPQGVPLNLLICLGCLYGELVRSLLPHEVGWAMVKEFLPWPCLVVRPRAGGGGAPAKSTTTPLGFSPIALVIQLSQGGDAALLERCAESLEERSRARIENR
jgi:hypothetical protein